LFSLALRCGRFTSFSHCGKTSEVSLGFGCFA
jgi:hypothetical protein